MEEKRNDIGLFGCILNNSKMSFSSFYRFGILMIMFLIINVFSELRCQNIAVKSNLLYDLTTSLSLGGEIRYNDTYSFSSLISYNPWTFADNRKMKHFLIQPEVRRWFDDVFQIRWL